MKNEYLEDSPSIDGQNNASMWTNVSVDVFKVRLTNGIILKHVKI
jgi:hypothetical protein